MNAALAQDIGPSNFSNYAAVDKTRQHPRRGNVIVLFRSAAKSTGLQAPEHLDIAASVKQIILGSSAGLLPQLQKKVENLANLGPNWDGEGAHPVKPYVLADVVELLKRLNQQASPFRQPFLAPTFDGFVQIEWRDGNRLLDIEAVDKGWSAVGTFICGDGKKRLYHTTEFERSDFNQVAQLYDWLLGNELIWPSL